jgi:hypothetical protein
MKSDISAEWRLVRRKGLPTVKALAVMKMCSPMSTFIRRAKTAAKGLCERIVHKAI